MLEFILFKYDILDQGCLLLVLLIKQGWLRDFLNVLIFIYVDLYNYMIMKLGYDYDGLKVYKGLQGYKFYEVGYVVNFQ